MRPSLPAGFTKIGWLAFGVVAGAIGGWSLYFLYDTVASDAPGDLLVPSLIVVLLGGIVASRKLTRLLGLGIIIGSLAQAIFFVWLFSTWGDMG